MEQGIAVLTLADRERWEQWESGGAMPSQCWRFAKALTHSGYEPRLAIVDADGSRLVLPYAERAWGTHVDIATLPGLAGASVAPPSMAPVARWHAYAAAQGWVAGYIQLSAESYPNVPAVADPVHQTHMFLLDPSRWDLHQASLIIRRKVTAAVRAGAVIVADRDVLSAGLQRLYPETLAWFGAASRLSAATLDEWSHDPRNLILGVALGGQIEAVHLIHVHGAVAEFHLAGVSRHGRSLSASLYVAAIERLRELGVTRYNLGGGGNPGDGLYTFKTWLGGTPVPLQSIRQIYDRERYAVLCRQAEVVEDSRWFPAYRSPRPAHLNG